MKEAHPYEEVAYDIYSLVTNIMKLAVGMVGDFQEPVSEEELLSRLKNYFEPQVIRHTAFMHKKITKALFAEEPAVSYFPQQKQAGPMFILLLI